MTQHKHFLILNLQRQHSSQLDHQKPAKMKKGHWQINGHSQGQLLRLIDVHFTLYQSRTGYLHRHSQSAVLQPTSKIHVLEKQRGTLLSFLGCFSTEVTKTYLFCREEIIFFNDRNSGRKVFCIKVFNARFL